MLMCLEVEQEAGGCLCMAGLLTLSKPQQALSECVGTEVPQPECHLSTQPSLLSLIMICNLFPLLPRQVLLAFSISLSNQFFN